MELSDVIRPTSIFFSYAQRHKCTIAQKGSADAVWLVGPKGGQCFVPSHYSFIGYRRAQMWCVELGIPLITKEDVISGRY